MIRNPFFCPSTVNQMKASSSASCMLLSSIPGSFSPNHLPASCFVTDSIDNDESMSDLEDLMEDITSFEDDRHVHFDADSFHKSNGRLSPTNSSETETTTTLSLEESSIGSIPRVIDTEEVHHSPPEYRQRRTPKASNTKKPTRRTSIEEKKLRKRELEEKLGALLHHHDDHHDSHPQQPVKKNKPFVRPDLIPEPLSNQSLILAPTPLSPRLQPKTVCPRSLCQSNKAWVSPNSLSSPASRSTRNKNKKAMMVKPQLIVSCAQSLLVTPQKAPRRRNSFSNGQTIRLFQTKSHPCCRSIKSC